MPYVELNIKDSPWKVYIVCILIILGLISRDMLGIGINKFIFLFLAIIPILFADTKYVAIFSCFVIPLYVGLPGNYISIVLLVRLVYDAVRYRISISKPGFLLTMIAAIYIFFQNYCFGYVDIYYLMASVDFIVLGLAMSVLRENMAGKEAVLFFSMGNAALGTVMLSATLSYYSLEELMNPASRLGYTGLLMSSSGANMATSIDPNFYAMNTIACISAIFLILPEFKSKLSRYLAIISIIISTGCCLVGLSRTFIVLLVIWALLWFISQENIKRAVTFTAIIGILIFVFFQFMPTVVTGLMNRFQGADFAGGNGRIELISNHFEAWYETIQSIFFGIGLFNCNTHCAPLVYLFGLGIVGFIPVLGWFTYQWNRCKSYYGRISFKEVIPVLITFISFASIPAAGAINYTLPMLIPMLIFNVSDNNGGS